MRQRVYNLKRFKDREYQFTKINKKLLSYETTSNTIIVSTSVQGESHGKKEKFN